MAKAETNLFYAKMFDLMNNYSNEMWNTLNSQAKIVSVTQQQWSVALMNTIQKHHQAQKEQMAIVDTMSKQIRQVQESAMEAFQDNMNKTLDRLSQICSEFSAQAQSESQPKS